jgi:hypothetical protein
MSIGYEHTQVHNNFFEYLEIMEYILVCYHVEKAEKHCTMNIKSIGNWGTFP